jgi:hypothetical protein
MHLLHVGLRLQRGRYELLAPIGQGGTGSVWRALDHREGRSCAIKLLPVPEGVPGARPELGRAAVAREEEVASRLDHPGSCRVHGTFEDGGWACVVMELCARSLADRIEDEGPLSDEEALRVCDAVAEVLSAAHALGIVHRDVKPQNILLREDGGVALSDWGLAHARSATGTARTTATTMLGTLPYLAPEVRVDPGAGSPASDVYALGITLAWACTGRLPGDPYVPEVREGLRGALSERVYERVTRACAWDPLERGWAGKGVGAQARAGATGSAGVGSWGGGPRPPATPPGSARVSGVVGVGSERASNRAVLVLAGVAAVAAVVAAVGSFRQAGNADATVVAPDGDEELPWCDVSARSFTGVNAPGPRETQAVGVADLDQDGAKDALFVNQLDENVTIWWGREGRSPGDRQDVPTGRSGYPPVVHDFDDDGILDMLLSLQDDSAFALVRGLGARRFAPPERIMQGPAPREVRLVDSREGKTLLFTAASRLTARLFESTSKEWPTHRTIANLPKDSSLVFVQAADSLYAAEVLVDRELLRIDADLTVRSREKHAEWPDLRTAFAANLTPAPGEELYGVTELNQIVRLSIRAQDRTCVVTPVGTAPPVALLSHLDADGIPDLLGASSCPTCTSNLAVASGQSN